MKLETFFEKFDQFADAPEAVAKMRDRAGWVGPSGLGSFFRAIPRALPWAGVGRAVGAPNQRPNGACQGSLGQRPRDRGPHFIPGVGRAVGVPNRRPNGAPQDSLGQRPRIAEQRRIVAKVDQLMALVDALETQHAAARATAANLLAALVAELTSGVASAFPSANGAPHASPGHRPGATPAKRIKG